MKANELMIGDWLQDRSGAIFKVVSIDKHALTVEYKGEELIQPYPLTLPIPLTPEILEKNGFEKSYYSILTADGYKKLPRYKYKNITQVQDICRNLIVISYSDLEGGAYDIRCGIGSHIYDLKYVHQLQHALRLCGIDKEIIL